jgi:hypothetical protein
MPRFGRYGPCLKASHPRKSSRGLLRKRHQAGSIPAVECGLKNAGENARPSADARIVERDAYDFLPDIHIEYSTTGAPVHTHRFGRKIKLPATMAVKHQIRMLMAQDEVKKAEAQLIELSARRAARDGKLPLSALSQA